MPGQAGVDFTIFQCTDAAIGMILGVLGGQIAGHFGYNALFASAICCSLASALDILLHWREPSAELRT